MARIKNAGLALLTSYRNKQKGWTDWQFNTFSKPNAPKPKDKMDDCLFVEREEAGLGEVIWQAGGPSAPESADAPVLTESDSLDCEVPQVRRDVPPPPPRIPDKPDKADMPAGRGLDAISCVRCKIGECMCEKFGHHEQWAQPRSLGMSSTHASQVRIDAPPPPPRRGARSVAARSVAPAPRTNAFVPRTPAALPRQVPSHRSPISKPAPSQVPSPKSALSAQEQEHGVAMGVAPVKRPRAKKVAKTRIHIHKRDIREFIKNVINSMMQDGTWRGQGVQVEIQILSMLKDVNGALTENHQNELTLDTLKGYVNDAVKALQTPPQ